MRAGIVIALSLATVPPALGYDLPPEVRERADRLVAEVEAAPTTAETVRERVAVLWEWANAASLAGSFVPKNLPSVALYLGHPMPGAQLPGDQLAAVDSFVRHLAYVDADPGAFGRITVRAPEQITAGSWQTIEVEWRVGSLGVAEGGGLLVSQHYAGGYGRLQVEDPTGGNYVSVRSSNPAVRFELDSEPVFGPYGGFRAAIDFPVFRVRGARLAPGETLTVTYGDRARGGRGMEIGDYSNDAIALPLLVDPGDGSFYELDLPTYRVVGGAAAGVHGFAPSIVGAGEAFTVSVRSEDKSYNRATSEIPGYKVLRNGETVAELPPGRAIHELPLRFAQPGVYRLAIESADGRIQGTTNPVWVREGAAERVYWGETHGHCGFAEGQGTPDGYFGFAREDSRLDFVTLTEHDLWLTDALWRVLNEAAVRYHREGELLVFPGYEWTSTRQRGGHHNVFFRRSGMERVPVQEAPDLTVLYRKLHQTHDPRDVLIIPHAHQAGDWRLSDLDMESLVEIMSGHGTFEWFGQRYLESGFRLGFGAASDDHRGHPGYSPGHQAAGEGGQRSNIFQFGGLTGAWAGAKTSDAVFDALKARHAYAVTGAQRIILDARLNGGAMGSQLPRAEAREVEGRVIATGPIRSIELIKNGEVAASFDLGAAGSAATAAPVVLSFASESWVAIRDNPRGQRTWRGSLQVEGARLVGARFLGMPIRGIDRLEVEGDRVRFNLATRGSRRAVALDLEGATAATRIEVELEPVREVGTAPPQVRTPQRFPAERFALQVPAGTGVAEQVLEDGPYRDRVSIERPGALVDDVAFRFADRGGDPGDWYYVRVEQLDGALAVGSPWWVGGEPPR